MTEMEKVTVVEGSMFEMLVDDLEGECGLEYDLRRPNEQGMPKRNRRIHEMTPARTSDVGMTSSDVRTRPRYADCWMVGDISDLDVMESYSTASSTVYIGNHRDGVLEYAVVPLEYALTGDAESLVNDVIVSTRTHFLTSRDVPSKWNIIAKARDMMMKDVRMERICGNAVSLESTLSSFGDIVHRHISGLGIFDVLLADTRLEDIYIDAPCSDNRIHITMNGINGNSHVRCRTNLIADDREIMNLISFLKRSTGLHLSRSSPVMETDMCEHDARATIVVPPMSPLGTAVAIRRHSSDPWTLARLVANGTIDPISAGLISFLVDMRSSFLICGARGAGKSSLLSAMMFEFPLSQRILTIEDTMELPCDAMRRIGYKVQSMLIDDTVDNNISKRSDDALRVSLRLGESAIVLGEVRGNEARTLYQSMRTGKSGSSIMGTIHGDSADSVYKRVVHDLDISKEEFMSTDILITMGTTHSRGGSQQARRIIEMVSVGDEPGQFIPLMENGILSKRLEESPVIRRILMSMSMTIDELISEVTLRAKIKEMCAISEHNAECISSTNNIMWKGQSEGLTDAEILNNVERWMDRHAR